MCFNAQISLSTYIIGIVGSSILFYQGYKAEAIFYFWVIQMQLIEFFLWMTIQSQNHSQCILPSINKLTTKLAIVINHMEPIILWVAILLFSKISLPNVVHIIVILFIIVSIFYTLNVFKIKECTTVTDDSYPHLHWKWNHGPNHIIYYSLFVIVLLLLSLFGLERGYINALLVIVSFMISCLIYAEKHSAGALWCFAAAFAPWILIFVYNYF